MAGRGKIGYPKRQGLKDFGLIDLPFPLRKMAVCPIGTLLSEKNKWRAERGVQSFPSVGDPVILPTRDQTITIVTGQGKDSRVPLGTCPSRMMRQSRLTLTSCLAAILPFWGNTGSGKSCTLAALVRSAVESAQKSIKKPEIPAGAEEAQSGQDNPNARFIIYDLMANIRNVSRTWELAAGYFRFHRLPIPMPLNSLYLLGCGIARVGSRCQAAPRAQRPLLRKLCEI